MDIDTTEDDSLSLAARRPRRENRRFPKRYQIEQPVAVASLPLAEPSHSPKTPTRTPADNQLSILPSPIDTFGLFRQYYAISYPTHDPNAKIQITFSEQESIGNDDTVSTSSFKPYPNHNVFLLGEWYWNGGVQKTKEGFQKLIDIVSADSFKPADLKNISWNSLNKCLGESVESDDQWFDEPDSGWKETAITLSIPFPSNTPEPGPREYTFPPFRHRSIVSVLKDKMQNQHDF